MFPDPWDATNSGVLTVQYRLTVDSVIGRKPKAEVGRVERGVKCGIKVNRENGKRDGRATKAKATAKAMIDEGPEVRRGGQVEGSNLCCCMHAACSALI